MKIGIVAGSGDITGLASQHLINQGHEIVIAALSDDIYETLKHYTGEIKVVSPLKIGGIIKFLKSCGADSVLFIGKVDKKNIYKRPGFDLKAVKIMKNSRNRKDDTLLELIGEEFELEGLRVLSQIEYLSYILAPAGVYSKKKPDEKLLEDVKFGFEMGKEIGRLDIGQTVVVRDKAVTAVEAIEGTDKAIERGCSLAGKDGVVVKIFRPMQDERFDIPTVGIDTLSKIADNKGAVLAVETGKTFIVDFDKCVEFADRNKIIFMSYTNENN